MRARPSEGGGLLLARTWPAGTTASSAWRPGGRPRREVEGSEKQFPKERPVQHFSVTALRVLPRGVVSISLASPPKARSFVRAFVTPHTSCRKCRAFVSEHLHLLPGEAGRTADFQRSAFPRVLTRKRFKKCTANGPKHEGGGRAAVLGCHFPEGRRKPSLRFKGRPWLERERSPFPVSSAALFVMGGLN